jgi:hypothetical protein
LKTSIMSMDAIHVHAQEEENMTKSRATFLLKQMTTYEQCKKAGVILNPPLH